MNKTILLYNLLAPPLSRKRRNKQARQVWQGRGMFAANPNKSRTASGIARWKATSVQLSPFTEVMLKPQPPPPTHTKCSPFLVAQIQDPQQTARQDCELRQQSQLTYLCWATLPTTSPTQASATASLGWDGGGQALGSDNPSVGIDLAISPQPCQTDIGGFTRCSDSCPSPLKNISLTAQLHCSRITLGRAGLCNGARSGCKSSYCQE